jgi:hypothetical protein
MSKTYKYKKQKKTSKTLREKKRYVGGIGDDINAKYITDFPQCTQITTFDMDILKLIEFKRHVNSGTDCFISALQIFGLISSDCADIMRLAYKNVGGVGKEEMESVFIYLRKLNYCFREFLTFDEFKTTLDTVPRKKAVFVGHMIQEKGHVFIIYKKALGDYAIIDPQDIPQISIHLNYDKLNEYFPTNMPDYKYYILTESETKLTEDQLEYVKDIASGMSEIDAIKKYVDKMDADI